MPHLSLDVGEDLAGVVFEPLAIEGFCDHPELDNQVAGQVLGSTSPRFSRQRGGGRPCHRP